MTRIDKLEWRLRRRLERCYGLIMNRDWIGGCAVSIASAQTPRPKVAEVPSAYLLRYGALAIANENLYLNSSVWELPLGSQVEGLALSCRQRCLFWADCQTGASRLRSLAVDSIRTAGEERKRPHDRDWPVSLQAEPRLRLDMRRAPASFRMPPEKFFDRLGLSLQYKAMGTDVLMKAEVYCFVIASSPRRLPAAIPKGTTTSTTPHRHNYLDFCFCCLYLIHRFLPSSSSSSFFGVPPLADRPISLSAGDEAGMAVTKLCRLMLGELSMVSCSKPSLRSTLRRAGHHVSTSMMASISS